ncbi:hypothetical protein PV726_09865 [Streptomyces europaeiscabiei]|uniref:hypothetical protein n=1 Tax=Streptomyces europaeiscabiei TaxID=146819 RepID=UPI0029BC1CDA|nr:hypothetical protein [Streptomyces europaeiscabiei]MDX3690620.1 hypothetical protein [Streptomyces europaeiscabiei]
MTTATTQTPFVVLAGAPGLSQSAALRELREAHRARTPVALIDGGETQFDRPPPRRPVESWSPAYQALLVIAEQLAGRIAFPRLASGLLAVAAGAETERILRLSGKVAGRLIGSISERGPVAEAVIEAVLERVAEGLSPSCRRLRKGAVWYRDYPNAHGNPKHGLTLLSQQFRADGSARTHAERYLVRALLADLDGHRTGRRSPVVLIDNVQETAGRRLMGSVLRDRAEGMTDQVLFYAALRGEGHPALRNAARVTLTELTVDGAWTPGSTPSSYALLVALRS